MVTPGGSQAFASSVRVPAVPFAAGPGPGRTRAALQPHFVRGAQQVLVPCAVKDMEPNIVVLVNHDNEWGYVNRMTDLVRMMRGA